MILDLPLLSVSAVYEERLHQAQSGDHRRVAGDWEENVDVITQRVYYQNARTGAVTGQMPEEMKRQQQEARTKSGIPRRWCEFINVVHDAEQGRDNPIDHKFRKVSCV